MLITCIRSSKSWETCDHFEMNGIICKRCMVWLALHPRDGHSAARATLAWYFGNKAGMLCILQPVNFKYLRSGGQVLPAGQLQLHRYTKKIVGCLNQSNTSKRSLLLSHFTLMCSAVPRWRPSSYSPHHKGPGQTFSSATSISITFQNHCSWKNVVRIGYVVLNRSLKVPATLC